MEFCPAWNATCHKCNRAGHYPAPCRSRNVGNVEHAEDNGETDECFSEEHFLDTVNPNGKSWLTTYPVNGAQVEFHIDTGAEVTVISRKIYNELDQPPLQRSGKVGIKRTENHNLTVMGWFKSKLTKINSGSQK